MKKIIKYTIYAAGAASLFAFGFFVCCYWNTVKAGQKGDKESLREMQETEKQEADPYTLTEEEKTFLQEHLYGQWRFSERIIKIGEDNNFQNGTESNISDAGVAQLKKSVRLYYGEDAVEFTVDIGQNSFTYPQDMYLFAAHGGFSWSRNPVYTVNALEEDVITLKDVYNKDGYKAPAEWMENFTHVTYVTMQDTNQSGLIGNIFTYSGSDVYIDSNDKDTIYIDFCGLWKMERDDSYYGTDGKSEF